MFFDFVVLSRTMKRINRRTTLTLFLGDILFFVIALWLTLFIRYAEWPSQALFLQHLGPFAIIFAVWLVVFFIFDLYRRPTTLFRRQLPSVILRAQITNTLIAIIFFYYLPVFGIAPRTNLFIYLIVSFGLIVAWRTLARRFSLRRLVTNLIFICRGAEVDELKEEFKSNDRYDIKVVAASEAESLVNDNLMVIFNPYDREGPVNRQSLYRLIFAGVTFINVHDLYEEIFERIPVSILDEQWFIENISSRGAVTYDLFKRAMDIAVSLVLGLISLVFYPFIILAIKIEDGNEIFTHQNRAGRNNQIIQVVKFRTMLFTDNGDWQNQDKVNRVTKVGNFLRRTRLDELPQLWNVLRGDVSLIGPRPEFPKAVEHYADKIPYYNIRHLIKPGLSGWAQIYGEHPHHGLEIETTQNKLSHDLYYVKHRGIILDIIIGLKTIRTLLSRSGI